MLTFIKNGFSKLTDTQVIELRNLKKQGETYQNLAIKYSIAYGTVANICQGHCWKHLLNPD